MPATKDGVDVYPGARPSINYGDYSQRIKRNGIAIRAGESVLVTKVKVKPDLIEFQLAGGGYGTLGDLTATGPLHFPAAKTRREKNLEKDLKNTSDGQKRKQMKEELDDLRRQRERDDAHAEAMAAVAAAQREESIRQRALSGGSRFNIRYPQGAAGPNVTPEAVMRALSEYVDFPSTTAARSEGGPERR